MFSVELLTTATPMSRLRGLGAQSRPPPGPDGPDTVRPATLTVAPLVVSTM
jgi:hypothetical protein